LSETKTTDYILIALVALSLIASLLTYTSISPIAKNTKGLSGLSDSIDSLANEISEGMADVTSGIDSTQSGIGDILTELGKEPTPTPTPKPTPTPTPTPPPEEPVLIKVAGWTFADKWVNDLAEQFMELHPHVTIDYVSWPSNQYYEKVMTVLTVTPEMADVIFVDWGYSKAFIDTGFIVPIENMIGAAQLKSELRPAALSLLTVDGELYGLPYFIGEYMNFWNKEHFASVGITEAPETWEEFAEASVLLKDQIEYPLMPALSYSAYGAHVDWLMMAVNYGGEGTRLFGPPPTYEPLFLEPDSPGYKALQMLVDMNLEYEIFDPAIYETDTFAQSEAGMAGLISLIMRASTHNIDDINNPDESSTAGQWDIMETPESGYTIVRGAYFALTANTMETKDEATQYWAWEWLKFLGSKEFGKAIGLEAGVGFGYESLFDDQELMDKWSNHMTVDAYKTVAEKAIAVNVANNAFDSIWFVEWRIPVNAYIQDAIEGDISVEEALQGIADFTADLVEQYAEG
jgi:ABC-type glycerol-3-phosphate transport system substrate-binding protein